MEAATNTASDPVAPAAGAPGGGDTWTMHAWRVTPATPANKQSKKRPKT